MKPTTTHRPATRFRVMNGDTEEMLYNVLPVTNRVCIQLTPNGKPEYEEIWGEFDPYQQSTGRLDKFGIEVWEGSLMISPVTVNQDYHGDWVVHEVILFNGQWLLSHVASEKGNMPRGYLRGDMLDFYECDNKLMAFASDYHPETDLVIIGDNQTNFMLAQEPDWTEINDLHQAAIAAAEKEINHEYEEKK